MPRASAARGATTSKAAKALNRRIISSGSCRRTALAACLCAALALSVATAAGAPAAVQLSGCAPGEWLLCHTLIASPSVRCNAAPVYYSAWTTSWGSLAARYTSSATWELVRACSTHAACFTLPSVDCAELQPMSCESDCDAPAGAALRAQPAAGADLTALPSLGGLNVTVVPAAAGTFACTPSNDAAQCAALGAAYDAMGGPAWKRDDGWRAAAAGVATDACSFFGVTCAYIGNATVVVALELPWQRMEGTIPGDALSRISTLTHLNLGGNRLYGSIPGAALAQLASLATLTLGTNRLNGTLPAELATLPRLVDLGVDTLALSGTVPAAYAALPLKYFGLRCSGLCGSVPLAPARGFNFSTREFMPPCDCNLGVIGVGYWLCIPSGRSPWGPLAVAFGGLSFLLTLYAVWRVSTRERGAAAFLSLARAAGCVCIAEHIASRSASRRAARKFMRTLEAAAAARPPPPPLRVLAPEDVAHDAEAGARVATVTATGERVRVRALAAAPLPPLLIEEARVLCAAAHPNLVSPMAAVPQRGWLLVLADDDVRRVPLNVYLADAGSRAGYHAALRLAADVATGLAFLHARGLVHGRLRAARVLVAEDGRGGVCARVADAGALCSDGSDDDHWPWRAPELLANGAPNVATDAFALGVTLWEIFHPGALPGAQLFPPAITGASLEARRAAVVAGARPRLANRVPSAVRALIVGCWNAAPAERLRAAEAACGLEREFATRAALRGSLGSATLNRLSSTTAAAPHANLPAVPTKGLSLAGLRAFIESNAGKKSAPTEDEVKEWKDREAEVPGSGGAYPAAAVFEELTTGQVVQRIIKPMTADLTADTKCTYVELVAGHADKRGQPLVATANVFVSHAWDNLFVDTAAAVLTRLEGHPDSASVYLWNDIFVGSQHKTEEVPQSWWTDAFSQSIASIGRTLLVLQPWAAPLPLTRAWCLWEIFSTLDDDADADGAAAADAAACSWAWRGLDIALPPREAGAFEDALANSFDDIVAAVNSIDASKATAFKPDDEALIKAAVAASPGGFEDVNTSIKERLTAWLLRCGLAALERAKRDATHAGLMRTLALFHNLACLMREHGDKAGALKLDDECCDVQDSFAAALRARVRPIPRACFGYGTRDAALAAEAIRDEERDLLKVLHFKAHRLTKALGGACEAAELYTHTLQRKMESISFGPLHKDTLADMKALAQAKLSMSNSTGTLLDFLERHCSAWLVRALLRPVRRACVRCLYGPGKHIDKDTAFDHVMCVVTAAVFVIVYPFGLWLTLALLYDICVGIPRLQRDAAALLDRRSVVLHESPSFAKECAAEAARDLMRGAVTMMQRSRYGEAEAAYEKAHAALAVALRNGHADTLECASSLAHMLSAQGRRSTIISTFGGGSAFGSHFLPVLLDAEKRRKKIEAAEKLLRPALQHARNVLGNTHPRTVKLQLQLAVCLERQASKFDKLDGTVEAQALAASAVDALTAKLGTDHARTTAAQKEALRIATLHSRENLFAVFSMRYLLIGLTFLAGSSVCLAGLAIVDTSGLRDELLRLNTAAEEACPPVL